MLTGTERQYRHKLKRKILQEPINYGFKDVPTKHELKIFFEKNPHLWTVKSDTARIVEIQELRKPKLHKLLHGTASRKKRDTPYYNNNAAQMQELLESHDPVLDDTRDMSWSAWTKEYLYKKKLFKHQIVDLNTLDIDFTILINPRQHGKTSYEIEPYLTRKLSEQVFEQEDYPLGYVSHSQKNAKRMVMSVRYEILRNPKILENYGHLIDFTTEKRLALASQSQSEVRLTCLKDKQKISLQGISVETGIRGGNIHDLLIDDPIDIKKNAKKPEVTRRETEAFMIWFNYKILPLVKGSVNGIGTRYDYDDVWIQLKDLGIFNFISRKAIADDDIPKYTLTPHTMLRAHHIIPEYDIRHKLLAPELWDYDARSKFRTGTATQNILYKYIIMKHKPFMQEFQNDPMPLDAEIDRDDFVLIDLLPENPSNYHWYGFMDDASGESKSSNFRALALVAYRNSQYFIAGLAAFRKIGAEKIRFIKDWVNTIKRTLQIDFTLGVETVLNQRETYQRLRDDQTEDRIRVQPVDPKVRGDKIYRIRNNFVTELQNKKVHILKTLFHQRDFQQEINGFPHYHPDLLDAIDQAMFKLGFGLNATFSSPPL